MAPKSLLKLGALPQDGCATRRDVALRVRRPEALSGRREPNVDSLVAKTDRMSRMVDIVLREAVAADIEIVLEFWRGAAEDTIRDDSRSAVEVLLERDPRALLLAADMGEVVG